MPNRANIGILTYHHITNFGAFLQAYSLQKFLTEHNFQVDIVDYTPFRAVIREYAKIVRPFLKGNFKQGFRNLKIFSAFNQSQKLLNLSTKKTMFFSNLQRNITNYNVLITGSDEIWNISNYLGYLPAYFLDFLPIKNQKRLSYAASMGQAKPTLSDNIIASKALAQFNTILVRDNTTLDWVNSLRKNTQSASPIIPPTKVVDPTLLYDLDVVLPSNQQNYFLLTGSLNKKQIQIAVEWAKTKHLKIISAGYVYEGYEEYAVVGLSPLEWAGYVKNADFHLTSLFHGSIFSLKNNRPFAVIQNPEKASKIGDLLNMFGLLSHSVTPDFTVSDFEQAVSSGFPDTHSENIQNLRQLSSEVFLNALTQ